VVEITFLGCKHIGMFWHWLQLVYQGRPRRLVLSRWSRRLCLHCQRKSTGGHVDELKKEWARPKPNEQYIMVLLRDTFPNRRAWIASLPHGVVRQIWDAFPCFEFRKFVSEN